MVFKDMHQISVSVRQVMSQEERICAGKYRRTAEPAQDGLVLMLTRYLFCEISMV